MKMAIFFTITAAKIGGFLRSVNAARNSNPQMFETDPESFFPAIYFSSSLFSFKTCLYLSLSEIYANQLPSKRGSFLLLLMVVGPKNI
jgi:hypothetical protein